MLADDLARVLVIVVDVVSERVERNQAFDKKVREFQVTKEMVLSQKISLTILEKAG